MFPLKMSLKRKKITLLVVHYCCLLSQEGRERERERARLSESRVCSVL